MAHRGKKREASVKEAAVEIVIIILQQEKSLYSF